jgi:hypothetical protein
VASALGTRAETDQLAWATNDRETDAERARLNGHHAGRARLLTYRLRFAGSSPAFLGHPDLRACSRAVARILAAVSRGSRRSADRLVALGLAPLLDELTDVDLEASPGARTGCSTIHARRAVGR